MLSPRPCPAPGCGDRRVSLLGDGGEGNALRNADAAVPALGPRNLERTMGSPETNGVGNDENVKSFFYFTTLGSNLWLIVEADGLFHFHFSNYFIC